MKPKLILSCLFVTVFAAKISAQYPYYKNFTTNDGLASNKVYNIIEDRHGFIWICTDQGVSLYDGVTFSNFTTRDGLAENEIIGLYEDRNGRIWFQGFSHEPCYYLNGRIYNAASDPFLERIRKYKQPGICMVVLIADNGSLGFVIKEKEKRYIIGKEIADMPLNEITPLFENPFQQILFRRNGMYHKLSASEWMWWKDGDTLHRMNTAAYSDIFYNNIVKTHYSNLTGSEMYALDGKTHNVWLVKPLDGQITKLFQTTDDARVLFSFDHCHIITSDSSYTEYDRTFSKITENVKLPFSIERVYADRTGNKWIGSTDNGLYLIRAGAPLKIKLPAGKERGIHALDTAGGMLLLKTERNGLLGLMPDGTCRELLSQRKTGKITNVVGFNNYWYTGGSMGLFKSNYNFTHTAEKISYLSSSVKDIEPGRPGELLLGSRDGIAFFKISDLAELTRYSIGRTNAVLYISASEIWGGGVRGITCVKQKQDGTVAIEKLRFGEIIDNNNITELKKDHRGNIWIMTNQDGLFCYTRRQQLLQFSTRMPEQRRLLSDVCLNIKITDQAVWLATINSLTVIRFSETGTDSGFITQHYTVSEGMPGNTINDILFWKNHILVTTPEGVYNFDKLPASKVQISETIITSVKVNNNIYNDSSMTLPYDHNNLIISYASSFVNAGSSYVFRYKVTGLNPDWIETNTLQVPLLGLKPGDYIFEIVAVNIHGHSGKPAILRFTVMSPWFRQWWFIALMVTVAGLVLFYYLRMVRERIVMSKNITLLRLRMLRAQMNPHFVFNALSNIQRLVQLKAAKEAEDYIGTLASVMRKSIDYSGQEFIHLQDELAYTRQYLDIEKLRFAEKFDCDFIINVNKEDLSNVFVPPLILQPLLENAVKHAFRSISHKGQILVRIDITSIGILRYTVSDNGCGFDTSKVRIRQYGLGIIMERVELLYKNMDTKGRFTIVSVPGRGTEVTVELPVIKD